MPEPIATWTAKGSDPQRTKGGVCDLSNFRQLDHAQHAARHARSRGHDTSGLAAGHHESGKLEAGRREAGTLRIGQAGFCPGVHNTVRQTICQIERR